MDQIQSLEYVMNTSFLAEELHFQKNNVFYAKKAILESQVAFNEKYGNFNISNVEEALFFYHTLQKSLSDDGISNDVDAYKDMQKVGNDIMGWDIKQVGFIYVIHLGNGQSQKLWQRFDYSKGIDAASGQGDGFLDKGLDYAGKTNDAVDAFAKTLGTNGLTAVMVSGGKTIGRYSAPAGIVISTGQVFNGVRKDGFTYGYNAQKATAGAVGGMAGAWAGFQAGAWAGFEAGFTIGLAFEGVGAIPGAVIGGIVGGFAGAWGGAYGGSKLGESLISNKAK